VVPFPEPRQSVYKGVRFLEQNHQAEYIFEPVTIEVPYQNPLYDDKAEDGTAALTGYETRIRVEKTSLDTDEFIAAMWLKGVRFGLQLPVVEKAMASSKTERVVVACAQLPKPGIDAQLLDEFAGLRHNNSVEMLNGKPDFRRYINRYPHIAQGRTLLKKMAMQPGRVGFTVKGEPLQTTEPKDLDLTPYAGDGTCIEQLPDGWALVAALDGFVSLDDANARFNITQTIETRMDITAKNTGDLALDADEFISHGEVQEGREVKGKNMRFASAVYGNLVSDAGCVVLEDNLSGGNVVVHGAGSISLLKKAFNARIEAPLGQIDLLYAENTLIIGDSVFIAQAVNCVIVANNLQITTAQACTLAGRSITIETADARRNNSTKVVVLIPDFSAYLLKLEGACAELAMLQKLMLQKAEQLTTIKNDPEFSKYLAMREMVNHAKQTVTPDIAHQYAKLQLTQALALKNIERLVKDMQKLRGLITGRSAEIHAMKEEQQRAESQYYCRINTVADETSVHSMDAVLKLSSLSNKRLNELKLWIEAATTEGTCVFSGCSGALDWCYTAENPVTS
jgi:hypothetical protein